MTPQKDIDDLREKYYHSMASALASEGDLEEAVVFLQKAIDIRDTSYVWHSLAGVLKEAGDIAGAVGAMSKAIKLEPGVPEYYHQRGLLLAQLGRPDLASEDMQRAIAVDANYRRIDVITWAADTVGRAFCGEAVPGGIGKTGVRSGELALILEEFVLERERVSDAFRKPSCPVSPCPAYCCHFTGKLLKHGVTIGPWKLNALRGHFKERGIAEKDVLETFAVEQVEHAESLFAPQDIIKSSGARSVVFPRQGDNCLPAEQVRDIPKGRDYRTLMWIDGKARPCVFLDKGKCSIYDLGGEASLEPCSSFLCMTGFVFAVVRHLGFADEQMLAGKTMREMNGMAIEAVIILARDVYGSEEFTASEQAVLDGLRSAMDEDRCGSKAAVDEAIARYRLLDREHKALKNALMEKARKRITELFAPNQT